MKNITQNNIDEWLFEYFEGNLSEQDSETLLKEVGTNNEFMEEFNYWKQSYLKDYPSVQYSFSEKLKKNSTGKYYWIAATALLIAGLLLFRFTSTEENMVNIEVPKTIDQNNTPSIKEITAKESITEKPTNSKSNIVKTFSINSNKDLPSGSSTDASSVLNPETTLLKQDTVQINTSPSISIEEKPIEKLSENTNSSPAKDESLNKSPAKKNKKNPLKNMRLKPGEEINKMNSNF